MTILLRESGQAVGAAPARVRGPRFTRAVQSGLLGGRPVQPSAPMRPSVRMELVVPREQAQPEQLGERTIAAVLVSFAVAVLLGAGVAFGQLFSADSVAPKPQPAAMSLR